MRRAAVLLGLLALAACHEPTFDERYETAQKATREKAAEIDRELAEQEKAAAVVGAASGVPSGTR